VITGSSSGIGRAIACALADHGARVCLVARRKDMLETVAHRCSGAAQTSILPTDLTADGQLERLGDDLNRQFGQVDLLIHSAGIIHQGGLLESTIEQFDQQYQVNVRAPYRLTQILFPLLKVRPGQIVFINSTVGLNARASVSQFAATQHALKAIADSLREELNPHGIRVLSVFPGRTATPRQESIYRLEKRLYHPELLLQPEDVAATVVHALSLPRTAEVTNIQVRPMMKTYSNQFTGK